MRRTIVESFTLGRAAAAVACSSLITWAALSATTFAAPINHGNFSGDTVDYLDVTEDTSTGDPLPLFGVPTVSGDSLDFNPVGFSANSSGGGAPDQTDGQLSMMIQAKAGKVINSLLFSEAGDTSLARALGTLDDAVTSVTADIFIDILETTLGPITPINVPGAMTFTPSNGDYQLSVDGAGNPTFNTAWTGSAFFDLDAVLLANGVLGEVTKVNVNIDNSLTASSAANSSAFIAKKDFDGVSITANPDPSKIPEPSSVLLALGGIAAVAAGRRCRI